MNSPATIVYLKDNDESVFKEVYFEYHQRVYAYVFKKTQSSYVAEEVLQLSFLKLWHYRHALDEEVPLLSQLFRIVRTTLIDQVRKEQVRRQSIKGFSRLPQTGEAVPNKADNNLEEGDLRRALSAVLGRMPVMQKKVFEMNRFDGMSYREIAQSLSISVKTVETHISRALKFLREHLGTIVLFLLFKK